MRSINKKNHNFFLIGRKKKILRSSNEQNVKNEQEIVEDVINDYTILDAELFCQKTGKFFFKLFFKNLINFFFINSRTGGAKISFIKESH